MEKGWVNERVVVVKSPPPSFWGVPADTRDRKRPRIAVQAALLSGWANQKAAREAAVPSCYSAVAEKRKRGRARMRMDGAKQCEGDAGTYGKTRYGYNGYIDARTPRVLDRGHFSTVAAETVSRIS